MSPLKVVVTRACRSDYPLSDTIIEAMDKDDFFNVYPINLIPSDFIESFRLIDHVHQIFNPDIIIIVGDRIEATGAANSAFLNYIPIAHLGAGITNNPIGCFDDIFRHNITLMTEIALCEDRGSAMKTMELWLTIGKLPNVLKPDLSIYNIHNVGNLYADAMKKIDDTLVPPYEYDLILYNPVTVDPKLSVDDYEKLLEFIQNDRDKDGFPQRKIVAIGSNPDPSLFKNTMPFHYDNVPHPQFLGLMKNCERYISNSSSTYSEAPYLLKEEQIVRIGLRNQNRSTPTDLKGGATEKIINILKDWWDAKYD